jgi:hypothetical protein
LSLCSISVRFSFTFRFDSNRNQFCLLSETLPDALNSGCTKCNQKQKETAEKVIRHLSQKRTRDWERLTKKYDPDGQFKKRYEEHVAKAA